MPLDYVYVKNGDCVEQVTRYFDNIQTGLRSSSGPDAFIADLLNASQDSSIELYSRHRRRASFAGERVKATVVPDGTNPASKLILRALYAIILLIKIIQSKPSHIICGSSGSRLWMSYLASRVVGAPLVHSRHNRMGSTTDSYGKKLIGYVDHWIVGRIQGAACHGPFLRDELLRVGVPPANIAEFDIDFSAFVAAANSPKDSVDDKKSILYVGRLETEKGVFDLLEAARPLLTSDPATKLIFAGTGYALTPMQERIAREGLSHQVELTGLVDRIGLIKLIQRSSVVVTPSRLGFPEGRCMAAMEALVLGVPVIAPNYGPFPYLVRDGINGLLFEPNNPAHLKEQLEFFMSNEELRAQLSAGAKTSGEKLTKPPMTFSQAIDRSFYPSE